MSNLTGKLVSKLIALLAIIMFVVALREMILTDTNISEAFGELMGTLPFAKEIVDVITKVMGYKYSIPVISTSSIATDVLRLAVMACIQPFLAGMLCRLFLRVPNGTIYEQEQYMESAGYKAKETILTVISAPLIALAACYISAGIYDKITTHFNTLGAVLFVIVALIIIFVLSLIPLLSIGVSLGTAITWRFLVSILTKMATTLMTNAICLWIYIAFVGGVPRQIGTSIITLIIWLFIMDFAMQCLMRAIV